MGIENLTALKLPIQCPLALLVQLSWEYAAYKRSRALGLSLCFEGSVTGCKEILTAFGRLRFGVKFEVNVVEGCMGNMQCNVEFLVPTQHLL